jgi:hypothetical protein
MNSWGFAELSGLLTIVPGEAAVTPRLGGGGGQNLCNERQAGLMFRFRIQRIGVLPKLAPVIAD